MCIKKVLCIYKLIQKDAMHLLLFLCQKSFYAHNYSQCIGVEKNILIIKLYFFSLYTLFLAV